MILLYNIIFYRYTQKYLWFISVWSSTEKMNAYAHRSRKQTKNIIKRIIFNKYTTIKPVTHTAKLIYHKKKTWKNVNKLSVFVLRSRSHIQNNVLTNYSKMFWIVQKKKSYNYNNPYHNNNFTIIFLFFYFCLSMSSSHTVRLCLYSVYNECDESL